MKVKLGHDIWDIKDRTVGTGEAGTAETGWTGQVNLIGSLDRTERRGQPGHNNIFKTYIFVKIPDFTKISAKLVTKKNVGKIFAKTFGITIFLQKFWIFVKIKFL
jgi:hypothetical protein